MVRSTTSSEIPTTADSTTSTVSQTKPVSEAVPSDILDRIVERAEGDFAVSADAISIERASRVVWRDSSLGCPEPGQVYMQVLTDGYWVILDSPKGQLDYRASLDGRVVTCEEGQEPLTGTDRK